MAAGLLGQKVGMTRVFTESGEQVPVTVVSVATCTVVGKRTVEVDGYTALRLGFGERKEVHTNKAQAGEARKAGVKPARTIREFRMTAEELAAFEVGQVIPADKLFAKGQAVDVTGTSRGRGFAGVFKRHHMAGFVEGHGAHEYFRHGGAIGQRKTPGRVFKNVRMPGHMGSEIVTTQNIKIVDIDVENSLILLKGAVPGHPEALVTLKPSVKAKKKK